ncbi:MAG: choline kinase [Pseudomonadota bacterium]
MTDGTDQHDDRTEAMQAWVAEVLSQPQRAVAIGQRIQTLWSGYGELRRVRCAASPVRAMVVKWVAADGDLHHPRGWQHAAGHARKLRSYGVEQAFYRAASVRPSAAWRVPHSLGDARASAGQFRLLLEDLDAAGYGARPGTGDQRAFDACVRWLAAFHATHFGVPPTALWDVGCYWHFGTREAEWRAMLDGALKSRAADIDQMLNGARYQTWVHGDAKLANFCTTVAGDDAAAVDFQYVGGGVGVRDLMVLAASAWDGHALLRDADRHLDTYFGALRQNLAADVDADAVEREWRSLWPFAWADYQRFLAGWMPGHSRQTAYARLQTQAALDALG